MWNVRCIRRGEWYNIWLRNVPFWPALCSTSELLDGKPYIRRSRLLKVTVSGLSPSIGFQVFSWNERMWQKSSDIKATKASIRSWQTSLSVWILNNRPHGLHRSDFFVTSPVIIIIDNSEVSRLVLLLSLTLQFSRITTSYLMVLQNRAKICRLWRCSMPRKSEIFMPALCTHLRGNSNLWSL